jgi:hypothetical protein
MAYGCVEYKLLYNLMQRESNHGDKIALRNAQCCGNTRLVARQTMEASMANEQQKQIVVVASTKSVGISVLLTILLGPLGMFYSTIIGAIVMMVISVIVGFVTLGFGLFLTWPICVIWGAVAASSYNKKLLATA